MYNSYLLLDFFLKTLADEELFHSIVHALTNIRIKFYELHLIEALKFLKFPSKKPVDLGENLCCTL